MKVKEALDELFEGVEFNSGLHRKLVRANIDFITSTTEHKELFGSRLIGCFYINYTKFHKNVFYESVFNFGIDKVEEAISNITTIPDSFKIARDDINLVCFYIAHRFLSNSELSSKNRVEFAREALNYFSYRTLVLVSSSYWIYPISEEKAVSLSERLSNKYIIKKVKNWNEYCKYRSDEYLKSKFVKLVTSMNNDKDLPNAISDLYNRTKETLKNIYREFMDMLDLDESMSSSSNVVTDLEGREVLMDRINDPTSYRVKIEGSLVDRQSFIKREYIEVVTGIVDSVSSIQLEEGLGSLFDYYFLGRRNSDQVKDFIDSFLVSTFEYLQVNNINYEGKGNVVTVINAITGNVLYARGTDSSIAKSKELGDKLVKDMLRKSKINLGKRSAIGIRNGICIYLLLLALL